MGIDFGDVGTFLGGATQGVDQGLNLYAKYDQMKQQSEQRQKQRSMEQKVSELAQAGAFKNDPVGAMKQLGDYAANIGDVETYSKYSKTADELQKADALKSGMGAFVSSQVSPTDTAKHLNDWATKGNMPNRFQAVTNPDGTFTMLGMGVDPKVGKKYNSLQELHHDTMAMLAPTMLPPEKAFEFETDREFKEAQTGQARATTDYTGARTTGQEIENQYAPRAIESEIGSRNASSAASYANAAESKTRAGDILATQPGRLALQQENLTQEQAASQVAIGTVGSKISGAETEANRARRENQEAEMTQADRLEAARNATLRDRAAVVTAEQGAANAAPNAELDRRAKEQAIDTQKSVAEYNRTGRAATQQKLDLKPFVDEDNSALGIPAPPWHRREENVAPVASYIQAETGAKSGDAGAMASETLEAIERDTRIGIDDSTGRVLFPGGRVLNVGKRAAYLLKTKRQQLKAGARAAAAAGAG